MRLGLMLCCSFMASVLEPFRVRVVVVGVGWLTAPLVAWRAEEAGTAFLSHISDPASVHDATAGAAEFSGVRLTTDLYARALRSALTSLMGAIYVLASGVQLLPIVVVYLVTAAVWLVWEALRDRGDGWISLLEDAPILESRPQVESVRRTLLRVLSRLPIGLLVLSLFALGAMQGLTSAKTLVAAISGSVGGLALIRLRRARLVRRREEEDGRVFVYEQASPLADKRLARW